jgi:gliding motility-associated lipoprotein GldH
MRRGFQVEKTFIFFCAVTVISFMSCDNRTEFEQYQKFEKQSWNRFNILKFEVPVDDTQTAFDIILSLRHLPEFQIKEFPINLTIYMPSGEIRTAEQILNFIDNDGKTRSECLGDYCDIFFTLREDFVFQEKGTVRIEIENKWPRLELPGVLEVGLMIQKAN